MSRSSPVSKKKAPRAPAPTDAADAPRRRPPIDILKTLDTEIHHLRSLFQETLEAFAIAQEGEIAQLVQPIQEAVKERGVKITRRRQQLLQEMIDRIRDLQVRPQKGRRKDLKKIESLVRQLVELAEKWQ